MGDGPQSIDWLIGYLEDLRANVTRLFEDGCALEETVWRCPSPFTDGLDPVLVKALATYRLPQDVVRDGFLGLCRNLHSLNILAIYRLLEQHRNAA